MGSSATMEREKNITILLSSHILPELQQTATVFGFMSKGKLMEEIGLQELKEKCADFLEITVSDAETYAALLDSTFPKERYQVLPDEMIRIFHPQNHVETYSALAAKNNILIMGLERHQCSLETYYMNLKGDRHYA